MSKFKVADKARVVSKGRHPINNFHVGDVLEVVRYNGTAREILLCTRLADGAAYWIHESELAPTDPRIEPVPANQRIVVTADGKTTTARLFTGRTLVKSAEAKCSPSDTFDFETGAALALDRLLGREKKAEPEAPRFDKGMLLCGRFGRMSDGKWFVIVGESFIYEDGGFDKLAFADSDGELKYCRIDCIVDAVSFNNARVVARTAAVGVVWFRPGAKFK